MATTPSKTPNKRVVYPSRDGRPIGETPVHRDLLWVLIDLLRRRFAGDPMVYVSGNMLVYYVPGDKRRHVSPDVWAARGVPDKDRDYFLVWEEPRGPEIVIELTSASTRREDLEKKFELYRDVLHVTEYFVFDPRSEYLRPPLRGFRLIEGQYVTIEPVDGRLPSEVLGLHLERDDQDLRLYAPGTGQWMLTYLERAKEAELHAREAEARAVAAEAEAERLRREIDELRGRPPRDGS
jgi:Uma2 family endonuclease